MTVALSRSPLEPLQVALYQWLRDDKMLSGLVTGIFDRTAPEGQEYDYVTIGELLSTEDNDLSNFGREVTVTFHVWTKAHGNRPGFRIAARLIELLDHREREIDVDGHRIVSIRHEFDQALTDPDPEIRHHVVRFRIITTQNGD